MCGISGLIHVSGNAPAIAEPQLREMARLLAGRGPDAEGVWLSRGQDVGLVNRRLATQDARPIANQPLFSHDGRVVCVLNGEVYNHSALRAELESAGCVFKTRNDTEVLANGFRVWGRGLLDRIKGQFAFAAVDTQSNEVLMARDRMGICPLYYAIHNGLLSFGSTVESLLSPGFVPRRINVQAAYDYFVMGSATGDRSQYEDVHPLRAGHFFHFKAGTMPRQERYHGLTPGRFAVDSEWDEERWAEDIRQLLMQGVESCMLGDKEVGLYLSGGIDSVAVMALVRHLFPERKVKAFSANFLHCLSNQPQGEAHIAAEMAEHFGAEHHIVNITPDELAAGVGAFDLPPDSILNTVLRRLAETAAASGVNVALSGEGSDELFFGYDHYFAVLRFSHPELADRLARYELRGAYASRLVPGQSVLPDYFRSGGCDIDLDNAPGFFCPP